MSQTILVTLLSYLLAWFILVAEVAAHKPRFRVFVFALTTLGALTHMQLLYQWIDTAAGQNLDVYNLLSFVVWLWIVMVLITCVKQRIENTFLVILPLGALSIYWVQTLAGETLLGLSELQSELWHILLSLLAYALLGVATLQALLLGLQRQWLAHISQGGFLSDIPPVEALQQLMLRAVMGAFALLTLAIFLGVVFFEQGGTVFYVKGLLSLIAWLLCGGLLLIHYRTGLKVRSAIILTALAWLSLTLAYFGTKLI